MACSWQRWRYQEALKFVKDKRAIVQVRFQHPSCSCVLSCSWKPECRHPCMRPNKWYSLAVQPNPGFIKQLQQFEQVLFAEPQHGAPDPAAALERK